MQRQAIALSVPTSVVRSSRRPAGRRRPPTDRLNVLADDHAAVGAGRLDARGLRPRPDRLDDQPLVALVLCKFAQGVSVVQAVHVVQSDPGVRERNETSLRAEVQTRLSGVLAERHESRVDHAHVHQAVTVRRFHSTPRRERSDEVGSP